MIRHPPISILIVVNEKSASLKSLINYLRSMRHINLTVERRVPYNLKTYDVVLTVHRIVSGDDVALLTQFVRLGGGWLELVDLSDSLLPDIFGTHTTGIGPYCELRIMFKNQEHPMAVRLTDAIYVSGYYHALNPVCEDVETVLYADWHYQHHPVLTSRSVGNGHVACTTLQAYDNPSLQ